MQGGDQDDHHGDEVQDEHSDKVQDDHGDRDQDDHGDKVLSSPIHLVKHATAWSSDISSNCFRSPRSIRCLRFYLKQRVPPICLCALVIVRVCASCVSFHKISYFLPDETVLCWLSPVVAKARCNQVFSAKSL